jgi:outer membrane lipoprotein-sorting protein
MSVFTSRPVLRWAVPAAVAATVLGATVAIGVLSASAGRPLPPRSAATLLVDLQTARLDGMSGTVVERADLGIPALPGIGGRDSSELSSLLSGTHTLRLWYSGPNSVRVALLGTLSETDLITNGTDLWTWSSRSNSATHRVLPHHPDLTTRSPTDLIGLTPQQVADAALAAIDPTTVVTTAGSARVAGRDAYELILAPRDPASLVSQIRVAIDSTVHVPLRVQVLARGRSAPAIEIAFTQVTFVRPGPEHFRFTPPPGVTIKEATGTATQLLPGRSLLPDLHSAPVVIGKGWTTVLGVRLPEPGQATGGSGSSTSDKGRAPGGTGSSTPDRGVGGVLSGLLGALPEVHGAFGTGHVITTTLFSVLVTDDGRLFIGAVAPQRLLQAAADPAAAALRTGT